MKGAALGIAVVLTCVVVNVSPHGPIKGPTANDFARPVSGSRVRLLDDAVLFSEAFSRFSNDEVNGLNPAKLARLGQEAEVLDTHIDRTITCKFDDGEMHGMPLEALGFVYASATDHSACSVGLCEDAWFRAKCLRTCTAQTKTDRESNFIPAKYGGSRSISMRTSTHAFMYFFIHVSAHVCMHMSAHVCAQCHTYRHVLTHVDTQECTLCEGVGRTTLAMPQAHGIRLRTWFAMHLILNAGALETQCPAGDLMNEARLSALNTVLSWTSHHGMVMCTHMKL